jgi:Macrocin-O-methyltransferase (TylF)
MLITNFWLKYFAYKVVCGIYQAADIGRIHPARERALRALRRSVDYLEQNMSDALGFDNQRELIEYSLGAVTLDGHYLEFGVFTGGTIRYIARRIDPRTIHGFDSFKGLPEAWSGWNLGSGAFDLKGRLPRVPKNVRLHRGYFEESLPTWLRDNPGQVAFIHLDCDLYSSTKAVLHLIAPRVTSGTVVLFDEYFNYANWEQHQFKAFQEFAREHDVKYVYLGFARQQVAVRIVSISSDGGVPR